MNVLIALLQTLVLPEDVINQVESKLVPPRPKEVTAEKALSLVKAKLDKAVAQKAKLLNQTVQHHRDKQLCLSKS